MDFKKKLAVVLSAATVLMSAVPALSVSGAAAGYIKGDIDGDGRSDARDAYIALKYYAMTRAGLEPVFNDITPVDSEERAFYSADMDSNNVINLDDAIIILKLYAMKTAGIT